MTAARLKLALGVLFTSAVMTNGVVSNSRFFFLSENLAVLLAIIWFPAFFAVLGLRMQWAIARRALAVTPFVVVSLRFFVPPIVQRLEDPLLVLPHEAARAQEILRLIASAQEQHRINVGAYAVDVRDLGGQVSASLTGAEIEIGSRGDSAWWGEVGVGEEKCRLYVGYPSGGASVDYLPQGLPECSGAGERARHQQVNEVRFVEQSRRGMEPGQLQSASGEWLQHRADAQRSGVVDGGSLGRRWDSWLSGEIRSSASVAGGQVFVGAHGSGEVASFSIEDGSLIWRIRAPNWLHHEPVVSNGLVVYGFGNNEAYGRSSVFGTPPNGFEAVGQSNGSLRWRRPTDSPAMGSPAIVGELVVGREASGALHAWNLTTGAEVWTQDGPAFGPMTNPVYSDSLVIVTSEPGSWCAYRVGGGEAVRCGHVRGAYWGAGHTSPAVVGTRLLFSFEDGDNLLALSFRILGFNWRQLVGSPYASSVSLVAADLRTGGILWRSRLSGSHLRSAGHIAGTPVVVDSFVVVPFPVIGEVAAMSVVDGSVKWRQKVYPARGSVSVVNGQVFAATNLQTSVVADLRSGRRVCSQKLPGRVDRAGLTISGNTGILTFLDGRVSAAPVSEWMTCTVRFTTRDSDGDRVKE